MLVVISGGSQGLGLAIGGEYVKKGWEVVLVARTESKLQKAVEILGEGASYLVADVSSPEECERVFVGLGRVPDMVVCCAGAAYTGLFLDMNTVDLAKNLSTVYETTLYFSHAALKVMANAHDKHTVRRHIVFCSSVVAIFPLIGYSAYAPAKAAIRALADVVRQECIEHNIRVSHIMPGSMDTEGFATEELTKPEITRKIEAASPPLKPEVVAAQVVGALEAGHQTVFTDTAGWALGSMMMGMTPRAGTGFLQTLVGFLLVLFGPIVRLAVHNDIKKHFAIQKRTKKQT